MGSGHGRGEEGDASVSFWPECLSRPYLLCNIFCLRLRVKKTNLRLCKVLLTCDND